MTTFSEENAQIMQLNRLYAILSRINHIIVRVKERDALFQEICDACIKFGEFRMAWIGLLNEKQLVIPVAMAGSGVDYLAKVNIDLRDKLRSRGPVGRSVIENTIIFCQDIETDPLMTPWRKDALERGFRALASMPICQNSVVIGVFSVYAAQPMAFDRTQLELIEEIGTDISFALDFLQKEEERKRYEQELLVAKGKAEANEQQFRLLLENAPQPIFIQIEGKYAYLNKAALLLYEVQDESEILGTDVPDRAHMDFREIIRDRIRQLNEHKIAVENMELRHITMQNKVIDVEVSAVPIKFNHKDAALVFVKNITQRKQSEQVLKQKNKEIEYQNEQYKMINEELLRMKDRAVASEKELRSLAEAMPQIVWITRSDGWNIYFNQQWVDYTGLTLEESYGHGWIIPFHPDDKDRAWNAWNKAVKNNQAYSIECQLRKFDGSYRWWLIRGVPVFEHDGKIGKWFGTCTDIHDIKQAEIDLKKAKEKAEESDRLKTAFLQNMSHEIRTPMNAIMGFSNLLKDYFDDKSKLEKFTSIIVQRCNDLLNIINDILDIARIESGQLPIHYEDCDVNALFEELNVLLADYQKRIGKQHLKLDMICGSPGLMIRTDKGKLKQILINLFTNAFKFTESGKVEGGFKYDENNNLWFYVSDTGIGIPPDKHDFIFQRFTQLNSTTIGGTGLGLSIVKGLVDLLGGHVELRSEPGKGSTFSFTLSTISERPVKKVGDAKMNTVMNLSGKTILVVEDDIYNAEYLKEVLADTGAEIIMAENGMSAVELTKTLDIDLVLMDIRLPDISGYEANSQIKQFRPEIKIIVQTAYASSEDKAKAIKMGCTDYVSKPVKKENLLSVISKHLG